MSSCPSPALPFLSGTPWCYEMMKRLAEASPRFKARIAGALSLFSLLAAVFGEEFWPDILGKLRKDKSQPQP